MPLEDMDTVTCKTQQGRLAASGGADLPSVSTCRACRADCSRFSYTCTEGQSHLLLTRGSSETPEGPVQGEERRSEKPRLS